jgi:hypothetical protein
MRENRATRFLTLAGLAVGLSLSGTSFAYDEKDAINDCEKRIRSEYNLSDVRDAHATRLQDVGHHYQVQGQTKIDNKKYPWTCEVKDRHVTRAEYSGPKPEGMSTAEKVAIGAAAAVAIGAAATALTKNKEPEPVAETLPPPKVHSRSGGDMEVVVADGCTVLYNDIGLRKKHGSSCTDEDLKRAEVAMNDHLKSHHSSSH